MAIKNVVLLFSLLGMGLLGCKSTGNLSGTDDAYANPTEERALARKAKEEEARQEAERRALMEQERLAAANESSENKNYTDPDFSKDDYYDYEYASRLNRFYNPVPGASYYDPYYTNTYTYNQNPAYWGTSIYSGWGMPSSSFGYYSMGVSNSWGYGSGMSLGMGYSNCYNTWDYDPFNPLRSPYCYSPGYYDPWGYNNYYGGYSAGYYNGYYSGMNNGYWGYYNKYDPNSAYNSVHIGPRNSTVGNNSNPRGSYPTRITEGSNGRKAYIESVAEEQNNMPRFSNERRSTGGRSRAVNENETNREIREQGRSTPSTESNSSSGNRGRGTSRRIYESSPQQQDNTSQQQQQQRTQTRNQEIPSSPANSGTRNNSGHESQPRNSSGGSNSRPHR